jgi:hypothetical protein
VSYEEISLTPEEAYMAFLVGGQRQLNSVLAGRRDAYGFKGDPWRVHIEGAMGEMALAKCLGRYWSGAGERFEDDTDVGGIQVRTRSNHKYELYLWPKDETDAIYVLVTGLPPVYRVRGWITGADAKNEDWFKSLQTGRAPAYFVPTEALRPMAELRKLLKKKGK